MTTKREQFTEWLRDFVAALNDSDDAKDYLLTRGERDEIADAAARIWEGPGEQETEPIIIGPDRLKRFFVSKSRVVNVPQNETVYLNEDGTFSFAGAWFDSRKSAEAALAKSKGTGQ